MNQPEVPSRKQRLIYSSQELPQRIPLGLSYTRKENI